jgi:ATP-binding cassette subfamily B (MDR/TAP) protein 1
MLQFTPDVSAAATAADNIISLIDTPSVIEGPREEGPSEQNRDSRGRIEGRIEAKDVHFHYPMRPDIAVLQGLEFSAEPGQYIAFVGASGSGKSTMYVFFRRSCLDEADLYFRIQLIERFYDVTSGSIYVSNSTLGFMN